MSKKVAKKDLSPEARAIINSQVTRRGLIAGTGAGVAAGLLVACGSGDGGSGDTASVRWGNWPLYLDYDEDTKKYPTLEAFSAESGIAAKYFEDYNDNDEFYGKVQAQLKLN